MNFLLIKQIYGVFVAGKRQQSQVLRVSVGSRPQSWAVCGEAAQINLPPAEGKKINGQLHCPLIYILSDVFSFFVRYKRRITAAIVVVTIA